MTLVEIQAELKRRFDVTAGLSTLYRMLRRLGLKPKKKLLRAAEQARPDVAMKPRRWRAWQRFMDPQRFVFIDETATATNMTRRYGRCPSNRRLVAKAPYGHWKTTTFVAGLRKSGITAPLVRDGPMTGAAFRAYAEQFLAPALKPGDVIVMDNLSAHKAASIRQAIESVGASVLYLPPYNPDLDPIEQLFAKIKAILRKFAARSIEALWNTIRMALERCYDDEFEGYLRHCGYRSTYMKNALECYLETFSNTPSALAWRISLSHISEVIRGLHHCPAIGSHSV